MSKHESFKNGMADIPQLTADKAGKSKGAKQAKHANLKACSTAWLRCHCSSLTAAVPTEWPPALATSLQPARRKSMGPGEADAGSLKRISPMPSSMPSSCSSTSILTTVYGLFEQLCSRMALLTPGSLFCRKSSTVSKNNRFLVCLDMSVAAH